MTIAVNTSLSSLARLGITGNKEFIKECRRMGLKYGVKLTESGGAQINFQRGGAGTLGHGDTVPAMGFTQILEGVTVAAPKDGFRAVTAANHIWVVLNGEDVIKFTRKGITTVSAQQSPFQIDNYDDEDVQKSTTEIRLVNYHNTPSSQVSFWTSRGVFGGATALQAGDQIGVIRAIGYKGGSPVQGIAGEAEFLANHDFGTYATGRFRIQLRDSADALRTVFDADADAITSLADIACTFTLRSDYNHINGHFWKTNYASIPTLIMRRLNGTEASPSNISASDVVGSVQTFGRIGGSLLQVSDIKTTVTDAGTGESNVTVQVCSSAGNLSNSVVLYEAGPSVAAARGYYIGPPDSDNTWKTAKNSGDYSLQLRESGTYNEKANISADGISIPSGLAIFIGGRTEEGAFKIGRDGNDLVFYRMESSTWVEKNRITAA